MSRCQTHTHTHYTSHTAAFQLSFSSKTLGTFDSLQRVESVHCDSSVISVTTTLRGRTHSMVLFKTVCVRDFSEIDISGSDDNKLIG